MTGDREQLRQDHPGMAAHLQPGPPAEGAPESSRRWPSWRVGRSQPHNVYMDDVHRLVVLGEPTDAAELAGDVVASLNADADAAADGRWADVLHVAEYLMQVARGIPTSTDVQQAALRLRLLAVTPTTGQEQA